MKAVSIFRTHTHTHTCQQVQRPWPDITANKQPAFNEFLARIKVRWAPFIAKQKFAQDTNRKKKKNEVKSAGHRPVDKSMSLHGLYTVPVDRWGSASDLNSAIQFKLQPCTYIQCIQQLTRLLLLLSACVERMTKKLCASCAVFCFPSDSYSLQPLFLILFFSSPVPCALILLDNIKIAPAREEEKKRTSNPSTTKERAWLLPIVSPRPASSSSGGGGRYIYIH